jgi:hypothetical protein
MSEIKDAFKSLSPEQQAVVSERRVSGAHSPEEWLALLEPVAEFDSKCDEVRGGAGGFFARRFARKHDLPFGLRLFTVPLLPILREDQAPDKPLELSLDFTGAEQKNKQKRVTDPYRKGAYHKVIDTFYDDPWIEGRATFADGTDVAFSVIDHVRSSRKTKRTPRGKIKTKTKAKKKTELAVTLTFIKRNYDAGEVEKAPTAGLKKDRVETGKAETVVQLSRVVEPARMDGIPEPELLLELIGNAYERVNPSRRKKL